MSIPQLFKNGESLMPSRGLLNWGNFTAAIRALKAAGDISVSDSKVTETAKGVVIHTKRPAADLLPFDARARITGTGLQTSLVPGFVFGGVSFAVPTLQGISLLSSSVKPITGAPKRLYLKLGWLPIIAPDRYIVSSVERATYRCPQGLSIESAEIVWTDEDTPHDAGWTPSGDSHVYARIRDLTYANGLREASVMATGYHYELLAVKNTDWKTGDDPADCYALAQEATSGGYGHRVIQDAYFERETDLGTDPEDTIIRDFEYGLTLEGVSLL